MVSFQKVYTHKTTEGLLPAWGMAVSSRHQREDEPEQRNEGNLKMVTG